MRARRLCLVAVVLLGAATLAACGSSSADASKPPPTIAAAARHQPSSQAKEICAPEAANDLATDLVAKTVKTPQPGWSNGDYTCTYTYAHNARIVMSVRDAGTEKAAAQYLTYLRNTLGHAAQPIAFGTQGAFVTPTQNVVVQKDSHVLTVDVSGLPTHFSNPPLTHISAAEIVAAAIMECWKGDS